MTEHGTLRVMTGSSDASTSPMQKFVLDRLAELNLTYRTAADRSEGLVSFGTLNQIATGRHTGKLTPRTRRGLALALDVPLAVVERTYEKSATTVTHYRLPERAQSLTPKQFKALLAVMDGYLDQYDRTSRTTNKVSEDVPSVGDAEVVQLRKTTTRTPRPRAAKTSPAKKKRG